MKSIVLWGSAGQAKVLCEFLADQDYQLAATIDRNPDVISPFLPIPHYHSLEDCLREVRLSAHSPVYFAVAIGGDWGTVRLAIHEKMKAVGFIPANLIHPAAYVARGAVLGEGAQILAKAVIGAGVVIGEECIVNTAASVDHECILAGGVHICPGATLLGNTHIAEGATIGAGAVIFPKVKVGRGAVVGAGSVVRHDVEDAEYVVGNPAKHLKYRR